MSALPREGGGGFTKARTHPVDSGILVEVIALRLCEAGCYLASSLLTPSR